MLDASAQSLLIEEKPFSAARTWMEADKLWSQVHSAGARQVQDTHGLFQGATAATRADLLLALGMPGAAEALLNRADRHTLKEVSPGTLVSRRMARVRILLAQHRLDDALVLLNEQERRFHAGTAIRVRAELLVHQLKVLLALGRSREALALTGAYGRPAPDVRWEEIVALTAEAHAQQGNRREARRLLEHYRKDLLRASDVATRLRALELQIGLALEVQQPEEAAEAVEQLQRLARDVETPELLLRAALIVARQQAQLGHPEQALRTLQEMDSRLRKAVAEQRESGALVELLLPLSGTRVSRQSLEHPLQGTFNLLVAEQGELLLALERFNEADTLIQVALRASAETEVGESSLRLWTQALLLALPAGPAGTGTVGTGKGGAGKTGGEASLDSCETRARTVERLLKQYPASNVRRIQALDALARYQLQRGQRGRAIGLLEEGLVLGAGELQASPGAHQDHAIRGRAYTGVRDQLFALRADAGQWQEALAAQETLRGTLAVANGQAVAELTALASSEEKLTLQRLAVEVEHLSKSLESKALSSDLGRGYDVVERPESPPQDSGKRSTPDSTPDGLLSAWRSKVQEREALLARIRSRDVNLPAVFSGTAQDSLALVRETRDALQPGELLLGWTLGSTRAWVWVIGPNGIQGGPLSASPEQLEQSVIQLRSLLDPSSPGPVDQIRAQSRALWQNLTGPVERTLSSASRLVLVPEGILERVPFAVMPVGSAEWLGLTLPLVQVPSLAAWRSAQSGLARAGTSSSSPGSVLVVADPSGTSPRLPDAAAEGRAVAALYGPAATLLLDQDATEANVRGKLQTAETILLATHAVAVPFEPRESYLRLATASGEAPGPRPPLRGLGPAAVLDGRLTAGEMLELQIPARVVVLSGCWTGETAAIPLAGSGAGGGMALGGALSSRGGEPAGAGLMHGSGRPDSGRTQGAVTLGLAQAFVAAGAQQVVASLWPVKDPLARLQSQNLFEGLARGESAETALRNALRAMVAAAQPVPSSAGNTALTSAHPAYWSPYFVLGVRASPPHPQAQRSQQAPPARPAPEEVGSSLTPQPLIYPRLAYTPAGLFSVHYLGGVGLNPSPLASFQVRLEAQHGPLLLSLSSTSQAALDQKPAGVNLRASLAPATTTSRAITSASEAKAPATLDVTLGVGPTWGPLNPSLELVFRARTDKVILADGSAQDRPWELGLALGLRRWYPNRLGLTGRISLYPDPRNLERFSIVGLELGASAALLPIGSYSPLFVPPGRWVSSARALGRWMSGGAP